MVVLVTGSSGFIGRNLVSELKNQNHMVLEFDVDAPMELLRSYGSKAEFVYHLAGVNRPTELSAFGEVNTGLTELLLRELREAGNRCPVMLSSSVQSLLDNPYGTSKKLAEDAVYRHGQETGARTLVYRFPNVFGKWSRPNYNSVVATYCHNISRGMEIQVNDPSTLLNLVYIDDLVDELLAGLNGKENRVDGCCMVRLSYYVELGRLASIIRGFWNSRESHQVPDMSDALVKKLYSTYLSYLPKDGFAYPLVMHQDQRGSFTEFIKSPERGQVSVNISKPGIIKGNHWHRTKNEKFLVVSGTGIIRFRGADEMEILEYHVDGENLTVVDIPVGYTHNIENVGVTDLVTVMWANEAFDPEKPDTYYLEVEHE